MITFLLIVCFLQFFVNLFLIRLLWFLISYGYYIQLIRDYLIKNNITDLNTALEYYAVWPFNQILIRFWDFNLRNFVYRQDLYDNVINDYNQPIKE